MGRQMRKTVMMMLAQLATAKAEPELTALGSWAILLLDFRKAYDTVSRESLFLALERFGFSHEFTEMIRNIHDGTTAQFVVNGELSQPQEWSLEFDRSARSLRCFFLLWRKYWRWRFNKAVKSAILQCHGEVERNIHFSHMSIRRCFCRRRNICLE